MQAASGCCRAELAMDIPTMSQGSDSDAWGHGHGTKRTHTFGPIDKVQHRNLGPVEASLS